ncbi:uncharacterized protein LOC132702829 isoform X3 [Cylas formicarius]|uniref:uncharacterized protein LOC132702829 isoform X3 n=1 Tax=Cylas formicarius TaxID=197179 RepID=UPI0029585F4E|nr:uncharacterized protein LOC132702829 isoform X3 [Cylas formicarius]
MEVVAAAPGPTGGAVSPFRDHDVREWSRIDTITGALERARIETDSWTASTNDGCHKYGKVLDSRARTGLNGSLHQQASRQLEVFQSNGPGARLQVIKTHTVSSSRWSGKLNGPSDIIGDFEGLQLTVNPLDVTSQKAKASVARSAIRRPPTRQRPQNLSRSPPIDLNHQFKDPHFTAAANLHRVSRLCHQIHETAVRQAFGRTSADTDVASSERGSGDGNASGVEIVEIESVTPSSGDVSDRSSLTRTKSISSEDLHVSEKVSNTNKLEDIQSWKRSSKIRRSLPSSIQNNNSAAAKIDFPQSVVSVKKIREELEKDKNLSTALTGNAANLTSFDQITQIASISNSDDNGAEDTVEDQEVHPKPKQKKDSFVTVESIQEIKNRLKSTDSPTSMSTKKEDVDDGIDTEDHRDEESQSSHNRVKSYVFGMEAKLQKKKPLISTGSLESKSKMANGNANHRNEDWYNRRKSYGFEQVHNEDESNSFKTRSRVESSTDSGICRSSDIDHPAKQANGKYDSSSDNDVEKQSTSNDDKIGSGISYGNVRKMTSIFNQGNFDATTSPASSWTKTLFTDWKSTDNKSTVTVPVVRSNLNELSWNNDPDKEVKRHSIAVDDVKFTAKSAEGKFRRSSLVSADHYPKCENLDDENVGNNRKPKKVEFCKTEIHFAADTGKVNIVETDEKPPPTHNFRRRRRNSGTNFNPDFNKNGLPVLHFGDSTDEKSMFGVNYRDSPDHFATYENLQPRVPPLPEVVDIATDVDSFVDYSEVEKKELENLKGILKNKPVKPKPYHLGDIPFSNSDEETQPWGSQLRVANVEPPKWRSVVTVQNSYDGVPDETNQQTEFQKLLRNLRPTKLPSYAADSDNQNLNRFANVRTIPVAIDHDVSASESRNEKIYSTRINIENSQANAQENRNEINNDLAKVNRLQSQSPHSRRTEFSNLLSNKRSPSPRRRVYSPITARKPALTSVSFLKPSCTVDHLSSSSLVGRSVTSKHENSTNKTSGRRSPTKDFKNADNKLERIHTNENIVLRQPKQSEMTYFGVKVNTKSSNEASTSSKSKVLEKPDLIRHYNKSPPALPARIRRVNQKPGSPIYENLRTNPKKAKGKYSASREFDSSILDELTKAADQILQVVNGYTNEDGPNRLSSDEEVKPPLDTISETKSWRSNPQPLQSRATKPTLASAAKVRVRRTSSTSSVESLSKERSKQTRENQVKVAQDPSVKKKASSDSSSVKASTKARRLQRACSREALLQSHGSSSEDLPAKSEAPVRKPRLIKKTKASQFTISNGLELKKPIRKKDAIGGIDERVIGVLPEIKRKTGMSSIRSTSESGSRDRLRHKVEDSKLRNHPRDDANRGAVSSSRSISSRSYQPSQRLDPTKDSGVTQHRVSTANIKRCHRAEVLKRH